MRSFRRRSTTSSSVWPVARTIEFRNFGVFEVRSASSAIGRNPNKPEQTVTIPERKVVKFKPGKVMKQLITKGQPIAAPKPADTVRLSAFSFPQACLPA
jgi:hypothetical protein